MLFNPHFDLRDKHAFLSPSNYHWLNYSEEKLAARFVAASAARRGSDLHDFAHNAIRLGMKLSKSNGAISTYVNDGIGYKMVCEQPLFYSPNCFGTPDTISFRRSQLRIHDLKTGIAPTSVHQLEIYAALFCLEYGIDPYSIYIELRIYQRDEIREYIPEPEVIVEIMDKIVIFDQQVEQMKAAEL